MLAQFIQPKEDTLTAAVFGHLLHLPIETFWKVLRCACYDDQLPLQCGEPVLIAPWPKWSARGTNNSCYVEPDLFIRFTKFDLIIEAKRWDDGMQYREQWQNELQAYKNEYGEDKQPLYFIALGGIHAEESEMVDDQIILKARWRKIIGAVKRQRQQLEEQVVTSSVMHSQIRVCNDLISHFSRHGYFTGRWFEDFPFYLHRLSSTPPTFDFK